MRAHLLPTSLASPLSLSLTAALALAGLGSSGCSDGCDNLETAIGALCLPRALAPETAAVLDVREACGNGCAAAPECAVQLVSGALYITLSEEVCGASTAACLDEPCNQRVASCSIPALGAGDYPVLLGGGAQAVLHVQPGGVSGCHLPSAPDGGS